MHHTSGHPTSLQKIIFVVFILVTPRRFIELPVYDLSWYDSFFLTPTSNLRDLDSFVEPFKRLCGDDPLLSSVTSVDITVSI